MSSRNAWVSSIRASPTLTFVHIPTRTCVTTWVMTAFGQTAFGVSMLTAFGQTAFGQNLCFWCFGDVRSNVFLHLVGCVPLFCGC